MNGKLADGSAYKNEFVFMTQLVEESGAWKIVEIKEFVDSAATMEMLKRTH